MGVLSAMELGIIGLPKSGKSTVFQALTKGKGEKPDHHGAVQNIGMVKVPDPRLETLSNILKPKRTVPAEVRYTDVGVPLGAKGMGGQQLSQLSSVDALLHVVRAFSDERVPHIEGSIDPKRDISALNLELILSDLEIIERSLERLEVALKDAKSQMREANLQEQELLQRIKSGLENEVPIREQGLTEQEVKAIGNYQFLSAKPMLILLNIGEEQLAQSSSLEAELSRYRRHQCEVAILCGKLEMELSRLDDADAEEFRSAMGLNQPWLEQAIRLSHKLLGLITFFTIASAEVKAWTVPQSTTAQKAAGKIHSDMERGFIRAEVVAYDDLVRCGGIAEARRQGLLRLEGKNYIIREGDVATILFHV
jgi:hypothetical protein